MKSKVKWAVVAIVAALVAAPASAVLGWCLAGAAVLCLLALQVEALDELCK